MQTETLSSPTAAVDTFPINGTDYIEFWVGNAKQASLYYRAAFGFQLVGYRGPETGVRDRASYLLQQDKIRFVLTTPIRPDLERGEPGHRGPHLPARRRGPGPRALGGRCPGGLRRGHRARRRLGRRAAGAAGRGRRDRHRRHPDLRRHHPLAGRAAELPGALPAGLPPGDAPLPAAAGRTQVRGPLRRQRRARPDEHVGAVLRRRDGLPQPAHLRRQGHLHRVLVADVEGDGQRQRPDQVSDQRAGGRASGSRRSTSTSSSTRDPACSTWPSPPTTSSRP